MNLSDVVLSCRVRLARNIDGFSFPSKADKTQTEALTQKIVDAASEFGDLRHIKMADLQMNERQHFVEKHLASRELIVSDSSSLLVNDAENISVMICEEDHLRIQSILPSLDLQKADEMSSAVDNVFSQSLKYAWSQKLGYLTACPTNLGTGMRASAMLHLTGLLIAKQTDSLFRQIQKLGIAVRGFYGEGSAALGGIFQLSNQFTLGASEDDIITSLDRILRRIAEQEMSIRTLLYQKNKTEMEDVIGRSLGICRHCKRLSYNEFMQHISNIKLGISLGIITFIPMQTVDDLLVQCQTASLVSRIGNPIDKNSENIARAEYLQKNLFDTEKNA
ncbi:MAG: ATP--guanido phosphotransferase [Clostridia bacterium]|nr:ATP--guanido phosphotransferase [Clostridia bacterium]